MAVHPLNAPSAISVIPSGKTKEVREEHRLNARLAIEVMYWRSMDWSDEQLANIPIEMDVSEGGKTTDLSDEESLKEYTPICVTALGITRETTLEHSSNACFPTEARVVGKVIEVKFPHS